MATIDFHHQTSKSSATSTDSRLPTGATHAVVASILGWTLDAFDFFVVVFLMDHLAHQFGVPKSAIVWTLMATMAMRPLGAFIFGLLADRYGRRIPLMANLIYFSAMELLCGFSVNYTFFCVLRALFGIGMGGQWGVGASLAMEAAPVRYRGILSGLLQSGYSMGYLLAAVAARFLLPVAGWRSMFWIGAAPGLLGFYIWAKVPESIAWKQNRAASTYEVLKVVRRQWVRVLYLVVLLTFMMFLSHGTQDLYPDFLQEVHRVSAAMRANIAILYNLGAVVGAIIFGEFSQRIGRRVSISAALSLCLLMIPLWAFGSNLVALVIGAVLMQAGVGGAWGVIPAHLNELSADAARSLVPGLSYQLGVLLAAPTNSVQYGLRGLVGYSWALASFEIVVIVTLGILLLLGTEAHARPFVIEA